MGRAPRGQRLQHRWIPSWVEATAWTELLVDKTCSEGGVPRGRSLQCGQSPQGLSLQRRWRLQRGLSPVWVERSVEGARSVMESRVDGGCSMGGVPCAQS